MGTWEGTSLMFAWPTAKNNFGKHSMIKSLFHASHGAKQDDLHLLLLPMDCLLSGQLAPYAQGLCDREALKADDA